MTMMKYEIKDIMNIIITSFCHSQKKDTTALSLLSIIEGSLITIRYHMFCFLWAGISKLEAGSWEVIQAETSPAVSRSSDQLL